MSKLKVLIAALAAAVTAGAVMLSGALGASANTHVRTTGTQHFKIVAMEVGKRDPEQFVARGLATGGGRDVSPDNKQYDVLHFAHGAIRINHPDRESTFTPHIYQRTCYATFTITGKYTLSKGTGSLRGMRGHGTYKANGYGVLRRVNGKCSENAAPVHELVVITASGPASRPGA